MAVQDLQAIEALQWAPSGNGLEGRPGEIMCFLAAADGTTFGFGFGPGWAMSFGSEQGDISLEPGEWIVRLSDGSVVVEAERPAGAKLFDPRGFGFAAFAGSSPHDPLEREESSTQRHTGAPAAVPERPALS